MTVDLLDYLRGDGRLYELVNNLNTAEVVQTQTESNNVFYTVKNSQWEELWADDVFIYRGTDTSPGSGELYMLSENNHYGSAWVPRYIDVGSPFRRSPTVIWRMKSNGQSVPSKPTGVAVTYLTVIGFHDTVTFPSGIQVQDVVELQAFLDNGGQPASSPWERYLYARGFGLVEFEDMIGGFHSWIAQKFTPQVMPQRVREVISWLIPLQKRYYLPAAPTTTAAGQFTLSQMPADVVNVRGYPNAYGKPLGNLNKGDTVTLGTPEQDGWVMAQKDTTLAGWVSRQNGAVVFTATSPAPPPPPPPDPTPAPLPTTTPIGQFVLTRIPASWVNVRDYPDTSGIDIGDLHKGDTVTLFSPDVNGWVMAQKDSLTGWVSRQSGAVVFTALPSPTPTPTPDPPPLPHDDLPPLPPLTAIGQFELSHIPAQWVNVRAYPDTSGADVGDLHVGDVMTLYTPDVNGWVHIEMGDTHGWVSRQNGAVTFTPAPITAESVPLPHDNLPPLPQVTPTGQFTLSQAPSARIDVRAYPNDSGADVGDLQQGETVTVYAPDVNGWVYVTTDTARGWVSQENGAVVFTPAPTAEAVPLEITGASQAVVSLPQSKEEAMRLRDAYQQVENGIRNIRTQLDRFIGQNGQNGQNNQNGQNGQKGNP